VSDSSPPDRFDPAVIRELQALPLFGIDGFQIVQGEASVSGIALAPEGDPAKVSFSTDPGIAGRFAYPHETPRAEGFYWYWPNSARAGYRINIDLAATEHVGPAYRARLRFDGVEEHTFEDIRTTIAAPKNLAAYQNYPAAGGLSRVQFFDTISGVVVKGYTDALRIVRLAQAYGVDLEAPILDWGVGHGRVLRHLRRAGAAGPLHGVDIDPNNIEWASKHLPQLSLQLGPLMPPTGYADSSFALVYGISVMTHLSREVQHAWLAEIARILRPGGIALLTFTGDSAVAFNSRYMTREWVDSYMEDGFAPDMPDNSLVGVIDDPGYYRNVFISAPKAAALCSEYLEHLATHVCMFGYQDLMVLRKPA
jgi:SAM-dependent methyltransferase